MKALVITVPEGFQSAVIAVTYQGSDGINHLDTQSTRGKDTGWALDFKDQSEEERNDGMQ